MAQFAIDLEYEKGTQVIKSLASIFITFSGIISLYIMNDCFPDIGTWFRIVISAPSLVLFVIAIYVLIAPAEVEW